MKDYANIRIDKATHKKLKILAAHLETSVINLIDILCKKLEAELDKDSKKDY